ncbi:hypothetical protein UFOVP1634_26 [uncultured Caudovirales phage]|uniref:Uncharacterized protein n=1 Tax=uncultured Caudovirales phage TaxID=2100421 RepID=A0A6J5T0P0_9CAUD|nr:hypothetical protein UFOVP1030_15 [uncultured Caudovirales phage]CAB4220394.1 hypothetical protein UFOVP1634_26 [uncultured Caudovirales phage]
MANKLIKYIPKHTTAGTEYREIEEDDKQFILTMCIQALTIMAEYDIVSSSETDRVWIRDQWWHKKDKRLHKGKEGLNSPCSVLGGIVHNMMFKIPLQRDFSDKQMRDLEMIFQCLGSIRDEITTIRFQIGFVIQ